MSWACTRLVSFVLVYIPLQGERTINENKTNKKIGDWAGPVVGRNIYKRKRGSYVSNLKIHPPQHATIPRAISISHPLQFRG
jgi:hypothetical protein